MNALRLDAVLPGKLFVKHLLMVVQVDELTLY
jgi:hypothetical protein